MRSVSVQDPEGKPPTPALPVTGHTTKHSRRREMIAEKKAAARKGEKKKRKKVMQVW